ncbi:MAG: hypothetical protein WCR42_12360 [bacterium]
MTPAEEYFYQLVDEIPDVQLGKMFGTLCMKTPNGKAAAMFWRDDIVVKLNDDFLHEVISFEGAKLFAPMDGRPMKEWVQIPYAYKDRWKEFALIAVESVKLLKKKETKKKI